VDTLLDEPAIVLVLLSLAAILFVVEVALPTFGVAGSTSLVFVVGAVLGLGRPDVDWWPLLGPLGAVALWAVMVARRSRSVPEQVAAAVLFIGGGVAFGIVADDAATVAVAIVVGIVKALSFPRLHTAASTLLNRPAQVGMESLVGSTGEVVRWDGEAGTVRISGSLWNAAADARPAVGDLVEVVGYSGMTVLVAQPINH
jgi:membrane-bound ClpP family serine protease